MTNRYTFQKWLIALFLLPSFLEGQNLSAKTFFNNDSIPAVYLGIDFTLAKLVGDESSDPRTIQSRQFNGINDLIVKENKKYDVQEAYRRTQWTIDLREVEDRNLKASPDLLKSDNEADLYRLKQADIENLVANFNYGSHQGYGVLLIMEGMSKTKKLATIWFTLINMNNKQVLFTELVEGKLGSGFGFRNYWSSAIKNAINEIEREYYNLWKTGVITKSPPDANGKKTGE